MLVLQVTLTVHQSDRQVGRQAVGLQWDSGAEAKSREPCPSSLCWGPGWQRSGRPGPCRTAEPSQSLPARQSRHSQAP